MSDLQDKLQEKIDEANKIAERQNELSKEFEKLEADKRELVGAIKVLDDLVNGSNNGDPNAAPVEEADAVIVAE